MTDADWINRLIQDVQNAPQRHRRHATIDRMSTDAQRIAATMTAHLITGALLVIAVYIMQETWATSVRLLFTVIVGAVFAAVCIGASKLTRRLEA